jgi:hypothetical protein
MNSEFWLMVKIAITDPLALSFFARKKKENVKLSLSEHKDVWRKALSQQ